MSALLVQERKRSAAKEDTIYFKNFYTLKKINKISEFYDMSTAEVIGSSENT